MSTIDSLAAGAVIAGYGMLCLCVGLLIGMLRRPPSEVHVIATSDKDFDERVERALSRAQSSNHRVAVVRPLRQHGG